MIAFHLAVPAAWEQGQLIGALRPASLDTEGFVHCSFAEQVPGSADRHFADATALVALEIDATGLDVRVEDSYGSGTAFPHVYGPIPIDRVLAVRPLVHDPGGHWTWAAG